MRRWYVVLVCAVVVVVIGEVELASTTEELQVTAGRDAPLAWPRCLTEGRRRRSVDSGFQYAVVVDAGSSGSRVRLYRWPIPAGGARVAVQAPGVEQNYSRKIRPGLSAHAENHQRVFDDIQGLLSDAAEHVPRAQQRTTPVYIMATAGQLMLLMIIKFITFECGEIHVHH